MIIASGFGIIGAIIVLANYKLLRNSRVLTFVFIFVVGLAALGIYFILNASPETDKKELFPMFTPLTALILWYFARKLYKKYRKQEIILYMYGLFPVKHDNRYVTRFENNLTVILLVFSVLIPYLFLKFSL